MNEEWIDSFIEKLAEHEGTEGRDVAIELRKKIKKRDHEKVNFLDPED